MEVKKGRKRIKLRAKNVFGLWHSVVFSQPIGECALTDVVRPKDPGELAKGYL
jgi:hypothetical protein